MQTSYEIQFPSRDTQRTPPYTGYIEIEPLSCPEYGRREKPFRKEEPTSYRLPGAKPSLDVMLESNFGFFLSGDFKPINPFLGGGLTLRIDKSSRNTFILDEKLGNGEVKNIYIHHDNGFGRIEEISINPEKKIYRNPYF